MGKLNIDLGKVLATQGGKQAILVTDDSNIARKTMAKNLQSYGSETFEAPSGTEGLQTYLAKKREIAMVVLDLVLPDVLRKPISMDRLLRVLHLALGGSPNTDGDG